MTKPKIKFHRSRHSHSGDDQADELAFFHDRPANEFADLMFRVQLLIDLQRRGDLTAAIYGRLRDRELPKYIAAHPGARPAMWWVHDQSSPVHETPFETRDADYRLLPDRAVRDPETRELLPEARVLAQFGLLTAAERRALPPEVLRPQLRLITKEEP